MSVTTSVPYALGLVQSVPAVGELGAVWGRVRATSPGASRSHQAPFGGEEESSVVTPMSTEDTSDLRARGVFSCVCVCVRERERERECVLSLIHI